MFGQFGRDLEKNRVIFTAFLARNFERAKDRVQITFLIVIKTQNTYEKYVFRVLLDTRFSKFFVHFR